MAKKLDIDLSFLNNNYEPIELPSKGLLYSKDSPLSKGKVNIRSWLTSEEKLIDKFSTGNFYTIICKLVSASVEGNIDVNELTDSDLFYILYWARSMTYGSTYKIETTCPHCKKDVSVTIDIADYPVTYLNSKEEFIDVTLPMSKIKMKMRCPRVKDLIESTESKHSDIYKLGVKVNPDVYRYALCTEEMVLPNVEGNILNNETVEGFTNFTLNKIWSRLPAGDISEIRNSMKKFDHGYLENIEVPCPECEEYFEVSPLLSWEFFRPSNK